MYLVKIRIIFKNLTNNKKRRNFNIIQRDEILDDNNFIFNSNIFRILRKDKIRFIKIIQPAA